MGSDNISEAISAWTSARKRTMRNLRAVKHEVTEVQNVNHLVMLLAGSSTTFKAEVKAFKTQSNIYFSLDSKHTALMSASQVKGVQLEESTASQLELEGT